MQQYQLREGRQSQSTQAYPMEIQHILTQLSAIDTKNKHLLLISDTIMKTSFLTVPPQSQPTIILELEQQMREAFNGIIESLREYYIGIDDKLKEVRIALQDMARTERSSFGNGKNQDGRSDKYDILYDKIEKLEKNLRNTQENESNLIKIIENMMPRLPIQEQPTLIKNQAQQKSQQIQLQKQIKKKYDQPSLRYNEKESPLMQQQGSFRIFSRQQPRAFQQQKPRQQRMVESEVSSRIRLNNLKDSVAQSTNNQPACYIRRLYANPTSQQPNFVQVQHKRSLKQLSLTKNTLDLGNTNKNHRLTYMMNNLKQ